MWNEIRLDFNHSRVHFACDELIYGKSIRRKNANKSENFAVDQLVSIATMIVFELFPQPKRRRNKSIPIPISLQSI